MPTKSFVLTTRGPPPPAALWSRARTTSRWSSNSTRRLWCGSPTPSAPRFWEHGKDVNTLPVVMEVDELVDAALAGFDAARRIASLPDLDQWYDFDAARKVMISNFSQVHTAE